MRRLFREGHRWLFCASLLYAPWFYGCTTSQGISGLNWILAVTLAWWAATLVWRRTVPALPWAFVVPATALLLLGWFMAWNAQSVYDPEFGVFVSIKAPLSRVSGSVDRILSAAWMVRVTLLLGSVLFVADLAQRPVWILRLWWTIGISGASIAFLGLLQKASGAEAIFWQPKWSAGATTFFASYYYHGNAGAFLNLVLPLVGSLALRSAMHRRHPVPKAFWLTATLVTLGAIAANTSRVAQLIAVLLLLLLMLLLVGPLRRPIWNVTKGNRRMAAIALLIVLLAMFALAQASQLERPWNRWQDLSSQIPLDARWLALRVALRAVPDAGWVGFGPGTFRTVFPQYAQAAALEGEWRFLHDDYLQTILEWGCVGSCCIALIFLGGVIAAARALFSSRRGGWLPRQRWLLVCVLVGLSGIALHSLVDFPLQIASLQLYVATYLGICWGSSFWQRS